jgi:hypothetical protein
VWLSVTWPRPSSRRCLCDLWKPRTLAPKPAALAAPLLADIRELILTAREAVARTINAGLTLLFWEIGTRIRTDVLKEKRADYGKEILHTLSAQLEAEFGRGFSQRNLAPLVTLSEAFPDRDICSHFVQNWDGAIFVRSSTSMISLSGTSTPRCAAWRTGVYALS